MIEQNRDGQLYSDFACRAAAHLVARIHSIRHYNGVPVDARAIVDPLLEAERTPAVVAE